MKTGLLNKKACWRPFTKFPQLGLSTKPLSLTSYLSDRDPDQNKHHSLSSRDHKGIFWILSYMFNEYTEYKNTLTGTSYIRHSSIGQFNCWVFGLWDRSFDVRKHCYPLKYQTNDGQNNILFTAKWFWCHNVTKKLKVVTRNPALIESSHKMIWFDDF